jgi:hypothetical protein
MSGVFQNIDPPPTPSPPAFGVGGGHTRWEKRGWGVNILEKTPGTALYSTYVSTLCVYRIPRGGVLATCHPEKRKTKREHDYSCSYNFHLIKVYHTWVCEAKSCTWEEPSQLPLPANTSGTTNYFPLSFRLAGASDSTAKDWIYRLLAILWYLCGPFLCFN